MTPPVPFWTCQSLGCRQYFVGSKTAGKRQGWTFDPYTMCKACSTKTLQGVIEVDYTGSE